MKKNILFILLFLIISIDYSYSQWSQYTPLSREEIFEPARIMKQKYDANASKVDVLIERIFDLKGQTTDKEFHQKMDKYYNILKEYYKYD